MVIFEHLLGVTPVRNRHNYIARHSLLRDRGLFAGNMVGAITILFLAPTGNPFTTGIKTMFFIAMIMRIALLPMLMFIKKTDNRKNDYEVSFLLWETARSYPARFLRRLCHFINGVFFTKPLRIIFGIRKILSRRTRGQSWYYG